MPLRSVLVAMVIHAPKNLLGAASRPVVATGRDGGIVGRPLPCHSLEVMCALEMLRMAMCRTCTHARRLRI
jgi:hypothetical protein